MTTDSLAWVKTSLDCQLQFIAADQHCSTAQLAEVLHDLQVVVGLHSITNDVVQALKSLLVRCDVGCDAVLAVQVEGTLRHLCRRIYGCKPHLQVDGRVVRRRCKLSGCWGIMKTLRTLGNIYSADTAAAGCQPVTVYRSTAAGCGY